MAQKKAAPKKGTVKPKAADKKAMPKAAVTLKSKKSKGTFGLRMSLFSLLVCALVFAASTLVFAVCMLPTLVAALIDKNPSKTLWLTIGSVNLAGTVPAWFRLWEMGGHSITNSMAVLSNPATLLVAYAGAAGGWVIHMNVTPLVAALAVKRNEGRLKDIEKRQRDLIRKWGEEVARTGAET